MQLYQSHSFLSRHETAQITEASCFISADEESENQGDKGTLPIATQLLSDRSLALKLVLEWS